MRGNATHHIGMGSSGHALARVEVQELVDLRGGQAIADLQLLDDENLPGNGLLPSRTDPDERRGLTVLSRHRHRVGLVLERHLRTGNHTDDGWQVTLAGFHIGCKSGSLRFDAYIGLFFFFLVQ